MPSKKKKYNARFPAGRIKKIMQSDEEIGKVAQAVPVIISRTLELFVESLLTKTLKITSSRNAKTLSTSHMKQCIMAEQRFDFLRELVKNIPDISVAEEAANYNDDDAQSSPEEQYPDSDTPYDLSMPSTSSRAAARPQVSAFAAAATANIQNGHGQNGSNTGLLHNQRSLQRVYSSNNNNNSSQQHQRQQQHSSVIMHTTSITNATRSSDYHTLPAKLARSESTPSVTMTQTHDWTSQQQQPRRRLKQQSQSLSFNPSNSNNNNNNNNNSYNNLLRHQHQQPQQLQPNQQKLQHQQPHTAIPAPIVSFDFCNKPIVKIDYSNLQMPSTPPTTSSIASPAAAVSYSAPVLGTGASASTKNYHNNTIAAGTSSPMNSAFDFNIATPVINIDLSNMVTNTSSASTSNGRSTAVATISIGPLTPTNAAEARAASMMPNAAAATTTQKTHKVSTIPIKTLMAPLQLDSKRLSNISASASASSSVAANTNSNTTKVVNSYLEMDEDYDNI